MWDAPHKGEDVNMYQFVAHASLLRATGRLDAPAPGLPCLRPLLSPAEVAAYVNGTACLARRVLSRIGVGSPERMLKDYIESPHALAYLRPCTSSWTGRTREAVGKCKREMLLDSSRPMARLLAADHSTATAYKDTLRAPLHTGDDVKVFNFVRRQELQRLTGLAGGGSDCLQRKGLATSQLESYENATLCLGTKIKSALGPYASEHVVRDFLEGPDNYDQLYQCLHGVGDDTRVAVRHCLRHMARRGDPLPVVTFWWETTCDLDNSC